MGDLLRSAALVALGLVLSGCGLSSALREAGEVANPSVSGELSLRGSRGEPVDWRPDFCLSGEAEQFFGFILGVEGSPVVLRAVIDPLDGAGVRVVGLEGTDGVVFGPERCERLELAVQPTGWRVNDVKDLNGRLDVSCSTAEGASVEGSVEVRHCH